MIYKFIINHWTLRKTVKSIQKICRCIPYIIYVGYKNMFLDIEYRL